MVKILRSTIMEAPIEAVWDLLRDFNGHDRWHPAVATSQIERGRESDRIGSVRRFRLASGEELREQLLALSDAETTFSYCLLDTPIPLLNYVAHMRLIPVTESDHTFCQWNCRFDTPKGREAELENQVRTGIYDVGFAAIRAELGIEV